MICNGLITCLYFGWFLFDKTHSDAEVMWFLVDALPFEVSEGTTAKKKRARDPTFAIVTKNKQTQSLIWVEAVKKATRQHKCLLFFLVLFEIVSRASACD